MFGQGFDSPQLHFLLLLHLQRISLITKAPLHEGAFVIVYQKTFLSVSIKHRVNQHSYNAQIVNHILDYSYVVNLCVYIVGVV